MTATRTRGDLSRSTISLPSCSDIIPFTPAMRSVEREFGRLKHTYGLAFLRVRGIERVRLHADLVMLGRLAQALAKARVAPLAA